MSLNKFVTTVYHFSPSGKEIQTPYGYAEPEKIFNDWISLNMQVMTDLQTKPVIVFTDSTDVGNTLVSYNKMGTAHKVGFINTETNEANLEDLIAEEKEYSSLLLDERGNQYTIIEQNGNINYDSNGRIILDYEPDVPGIVRLSYRDHKPAGWLLPSEFHANNVLKDRSLLTLREKANVLLFTLENGIDPMSIIIIRLNNNLEIFATETGKIDEDTVLKGIYEFITGEAYTKPSCVVPHSLKAELRNIPSYFFDCYYSNQLNKVAINAALTLISYFGG